MDTYTSSQLDLLAYEVQPGDNLHRIISRYYGSMKQQRVQGVIDQIVEANTHIRNPNLIRPGQIIKLSVPRQYCAAPKGFPNNINLFDTMAHTPWFGVLNEDWGRATPEERSFIQKASPFLIGSGTVALSTLNTTFRTNAPLVGEIAGHYEAYNNGDITKNQYDYRRRKSLTQLSNNLGPTQRLLYGDRTPGEVIRISRRSGLSPTANIDREVSRMTGVSKVVSRSGVALSVIGLGIACHEIARTESRDRQNEIFMESAGGVAAGVVYGVGATFGLAMMATPIGWGAALLVGAGGAITGYVGSRGARKLYDARGTEIDFIQKLGVSKACASNSSTQTSATNQVSRGLATFQR